MTKKEEAPVLSTEASQSKGSEPIVQPAAQSYRDSTISPDEARRAQETLAEYLPSNIRDKLNRFLTRELTEYLSQNGGIDRLSGLENLLPPLHTINSATILQTEYPPTPFVIADYLPIGLIFLYGKPKIGKSWLALQIGLAVLCGGKIFGKEVLKGRVLYLALEDREKRLKKRMTLQNWPTDIGIDFMFAKPFREQIGALNTGGGKRLLAYVEAKNYLLVIVDTFSRAIQGDQLKSNEMTDAIGPLQEFAQQNDKAIVLIDHEPKSTNNDTDAITGLYGSVAKSGVADTSWRLYKERGKYGAKLDLEGRDLDDQYNLKLTFDKESYYWHSEGNAFELDLTARRKEILDALDVLGRSQLRQIAEAIGQPTSHTHTRLQDLTNEGLVNRISVRSNIFYELAG